MVENASHGAKFKLKYLYFLQPLLLLFAVESACADSRQEIVLNVFEEGTRDPVANTTAIFFDAKGREIARALGKNSTCSEGRHCLYWSTTDRDGRNYSTQSEYHPEHIKSEPKNAVRVRLSAPNCKQRELPLSLEKKYIKGTGLFCFHGCHRAYWKYSTRQNVSLSCSLNAEQHRVSQNLHMFYDVSRPCPGQLKAGIKIAETPEELILQFRPDFTIEQFGVEYARVVDWSLAVCEQKMVFNFAQAIELLKRLRGQEEAVKPLYGVIRNKFFRRNLHRMAIDQLVKWEDPGLADFLLPELESCKDYANCEFFLRARVKLQAHPDQSRENQLRQLEGFKDHSNPSVRDAVVKRRENPGSWL